MPMKDAPTPGTALVVGLGEALFDRIDGHFILGGAPVNFAVHAHQMLQPTGSEAVVASRIGVDPLGERLLDELSSRGLDNAWIQRDETAPTGVVEVDVDAAGHPSYTINTGAAWDRFEFTPDWAELASRCRAVCFGTLAQRSTASREAVRRFLAESPGAMRVCDINLRQQYFDRVTIHASLEASTVLKLNEEELAVVCELLEAPPSAAAGDVDDAIRWLIEAYELEALAFTRGERGVLLYYGGQRFDEPPTPATPQPGADSVGAGDACCAALVVGMLRGFPPERILRLANQAGALVASHRGATPRLPDELAAAFGA
ncbi:MAG: carbohydrate kinase [Planctomycetota bacterium]|nr:MAG: carbohydrate kinase [Planctomycetota bacterium]